MQADDQARQRIETMLDENRVVLFMKGTREAPQCGFSAATIGVLEALGHEYETFNVLEDQSIREGIKQYSDWPTIPQLYVDKEFLGGCDIVRQMFNSGELHEAFGLEAPDRTPPEIELSDEAASMIGDAVRQAPPGMAVHLQIGANWTHEFGLRPADGHEIKSTSNGVEILMDVATAQRAKGLRVELEQGLAGTELKISNPNMPA